MASWQGCDETAEERARRLAEELRQCQADKDFVWSLWKRLQEDKPDVSQVVRMVIQRENQRAEEKASKVLEILQVKDHKIRELEQQSNAQQRELDDLERRRAAVEESISLREQLSALSTHWEESTSKTQALRHEDVETESVLVQELRKRCADLQMLLDNAQDAAKAGIEKQQQADRLQNRVDELSSQLSVQERELAQARKDLEEVQALCRESVRHTCKQTHLLKEMQSLHLKNQHTLQQQEELHKASIKQQEESTTGELSRLLNIIQEQRRALEAKDKQLAELQSRVACWEDDAETERRLSQEKRDRRMDAQQQEGAHQSATSKLEQRVKELVEERAHQKTKLENIQQRLAMTSRENVLLENGSRELRVQLQTKEQQVHALEKGMQQAERTAGELHAAARSEMHALAGKSEHAQACVAEFKSIVRVLASELQQQVNEVRAALLHREQRDANVSVAVSQAKILAASILNLSESELSEIMDANQMAETCEDEMWMQQLDIILDSQPPFSVALQQHLREKRQERARLASQLQQQDATPQHKQQPPMWSHLGFDL